MDKFLELKIDVGGGAESTPFPNENDPIIIGAFRYDAKRMGGAPTITASVNYPTCLDNEWTDKVYAEFNGEKYYLKQTPTSSYDNEDVMYRHDLELVSERVNLDNVYFFDTVVGDPQGSDKPVSNSTKVVFFGNINEFVARLNSSLEYSGLDYTVVVDDDDNITTEEKLMSFEDQFFSNVLQEIYNTYKVPYYFEGKTIHIGYSNSDAVVPTFSYGVDNALLSITKNNANYKIVNRATATGSSDNIPFYYPNNSPKGDIEAFVSREGADVVIKDYERYANEVGLGEAIRYSAVPQVTITKVLDKNGNNYFTGGTQYRECGWMGFNDEFTIYINADKEANIALDIAPVSQFGKRESDGGLTEALYSVVTKVFVDGKQVGDSNNVIEMTVKAGETIVKAYMNYRFDHTQSSYTFIGNSGISYSVETLDTYAWYLGDKKVEPEKLGIKVGDVSVFREGDTITQRLVTYVKTSQNLMPSIYRETDGDERFYNATNNTYEGVEFNNPFVEGHPKEHIFTVDDIKPTIKETIVNGLRIDMFSEFAYDEDDNDETYEDEEGNVYFKHPYFYGKLRVMDFNLFDHAIEQQPMTISFTSGHCGACNFEIGVTEDYPQKNPVQVDEYGNLVRDEKGMVLAGVEGTQQLVTTFQERQQDTSKYEVWIALRKEESTYGILMPQVAHRPKAAKNEDGTPNNEGDTFVILGINLPQSYILNAEKKLEAEIIKYLQDNNDEKFTFSIGFSRIYFEENSILDQLSENSKIAIMYNGQRYDLYVSSFSYSMSEGDVLPEIRVELDDTLKVSQNALQNAISEVKSELGRAIGNIDVVGAATPYFIRKDADDEAQGRINFKKGIKFGEGGKVEVLDNNSAKLTIEYLEVTKKASFTSLEIQEKTHVGGQILVTPAAINCGEVEEFEDFYRCYFQTKGADGDEIFNQFAVGDQAVCQTYNAWGSVYYWRLVTGIGEDYIDLSKTECDEESGVPKAGDKIVQLGNQIDPSRQNAIVIAAYGDGSPYIIQYKGIDTFELSKDKMVTKLAPDENIFTGKVHMELGSDGFENLGGSLNIGGQNLLRNSGFTGDYLSEPLADREVMEASKELFSDPLDHWKDDDTEDGVDMESWGAEVIELAGVSASGYGASLNDVTNEDGTTTSARLYQNLYYDLIGGETYVLSFKAMGSAVTCIVGDYTEVVTLTDEWAKYTIKATPSVSSKVFSIVGTGVTLCEIQLERGTMATSWGMSPLDNSSDKTYYESIKYLSQSMVEEAITEGATDVLGGVVLTNHIKVGNYANQTMIKETGGVSGTYYADDDSVAFWGGGDFASAIEAVSKFKDNPAYQPTEEELASMAKFVVTHGGRAILNDIILRGYVYAKGGDFGDLKIGKYVNACGNADAEDSVFTETAHTVGDVNYKTMVQLSSGAVTAIGTHYDGRTCYFGNTIIIDADSDPQKNRYNASLYIDANTADALKVNNGDIVHISGNYHGFRPTTRVVNGDTNLAYGESGVIIADTSNSSFTIYLPSTRRNGANFEIHKVGGTTNALIIEEDAEIIYYNGQTMSQYLVGEECCIRLVYSSDAQKWYMTIV